MKKIIFNAIIILGLGISPLFSRTVFAQGMMGFPSLSTDNAAIKSQQQEEREGKKFLDDLNNKIITCSQIIDSDFEKIGEYFMGQSIGETSRHMAMNEMMKSMMGERGEEQMHLAWGKRGSGCAASAAFPAPGIGFMPMMQMMMGGWSSPLGSSQAGNSMMNFGFTPLGGFGWVLMILWWGLIITGLVALIKWFTDQSRGAHDHGRSPLEILKERYAKGEIDRKEFEERKKDLS